MINKTIDNFGKKMGFETLTFNEHKVIHLELETIGDLYLEDTVSHLLIYLIKKIENPSLKLYQKALTLCHYRQKNPYPTYTGLYEEDKLAFLFKIPYEEISESNLEKSIFLLNNLHEQIANINNL